MSSTVAETTTAVATTAKIVKPKKLKPARKQVKPGEVEKKETPQTGKEYSSFDLDVLTRRWLLTALLLLDIWYNKWAGGDREDSYSKCVTCYVSSKVYN